MSLLRGTEAQEIPGERNWRTELVPRVSIVAVLLIGLSGIAVTAGFTTETMRIFGLCLIGSSVVLIGLLSTRRIPHDTKAVIVVGSIGVASVLSYLLGGFLPGSALAATATLVFAALLIGRTVFIAIFLGFTTLMIALTAAVGVGFWHGPEFASIDPGNVTNWIRTSIVSVIIWASLGFSVMFIINTIEENLARRRTALESLKTEIAERRAAVNARRDAEFVANEAQKMETVGQFAAAIAHDFNNALHVIKAWNEIRGDADVDDSQREATHAIEQAADHSAQLGRQLLTFARKDVRTPRYLFLDKLVEDNLQSLRNIVGPLIHLHVETQTDALVFADESQLQQLIFNLVINARDALAGPGNIRVSLRRVAASEIDESASEHDFRVVLEVEDDGPGIDSVMQERIFEPFFTTKMPGKGTGLGLPTVASIVRQSSGRIDLESRPGKTTFSVRLPSVSAESEKTAAEPATAETGKLGLRVLVLEDDPQARRLMVAALTRNGNEVVQCGDGDTAIAILGDDPHRFDLLCSDAVFPGAQLGNVLDAFEQHSPSANILICSGYVRDDIAKLESSEYAFLAKPFAGSQLIAKIREVVS